jgi:hypothetical protein
MNTSAVPTGLPPPAPPLALEPVVDEEEALDAVDPWSALGFDSLPHADIDRAATKTSVSRERRGKFFVMRRFEHRKGLHRSPNCIAAALAGGGESFDDSRR